MSELLTCDGVLDLGDVREVGCVRNSQTTHAVSVSPLLRQHHYFHDVISKQIESTEMCSAYSKVALEGLGTAVSVVAADLARVADVESVKLVQPVRNRLQGTQYIQVQYRTEKFRNGGATRTFPSQPSGTFL